MNLWYGWGPRAQALAREKGIEEILLSLSHTGDMLWPKSLLGKEDTMRL